MKLTLLLIAMQISAFCRAGETAVDVRGRVFESAGTSPDLIFVGDGKTVFAQGFHKIQSMAWHGRDLWVSNAPDLTIVRDLDGDDRADEYVLVGRHLGDKEHGLHGLAWGADGKLYLCTGDLASMPTHELGRAMRFHQGEYERLPESPVARAAYEGAVLRCDPDGRELEVVARGFDNPQSFRFDEGFNGFVLGREGGWSRFFFGSKKLPGEPGNTQPFQPDRKVRPPYDQWTFDELLEDLGSSVAAWAVAAQEEFLKRGESIKVGLIQRLAGSDLPPQQRTWALWTLGRAGKDDVEIEAWFARQPGIAQDLNTRIQCLRIIACRMREFGFTKVVPPCVIEALNDAEPRIRFEAVQALWQARQAAQVPALIELAAREQDADTFYSAWNALVDLADEATLKRCLADSREGVRRAAGLAIKKQGK